MEEKKDAIDALLELIDTLEKIRAQFEIVLKTAEVIHRVGGLTYSLIRIPDLALDTANDILSLILFGEKKKK